MYEGFTPNTTKGMAKQNYSRLRSCPGRRPARCRPLQPTAQQRKAACRRCTSKPPCRDVKKCGKNGCLYVHAKRKFACSGDVSPVNITSNCIAKILARQPLDPFTMTPTEKLPWSCPLQVTLNCRARQFSFSPGRGTDHRSTRRSFPDRFVKGHRAPSSRTS